MGVRIHGGESKAPIYEGVNVKNLLTLALALSLLSTPISALANKKVNLPAVQPHATISSSSSSSSSSTDPIPNEIPSKKRWISEASSKLRKKAEASVKKMKAEDRTKVLKLLNGGKSYSLQKIRGIGKVRAAHVIKGRPYKTLDSVIDVAGIGEKTFANIIKHAKKL